MKMKKAVRMPLRRAPQRRRSATAPLRARAATVDEAYDDEEEDYGAEEEPNMKFSHALLVVLVLHIIAVGGVFAFNWMKSRQGAEAPVAKTSAAEKASPSERAPRTEAPAKPAPVAKAATIEGWTGKTHTVQAGDTLIHIAAAYKTSVMAIEKENEITSTSMLRVGQVLKIPGTEKAAKTSETAGSSATKDAFLAAKAESPGTISAVSRTAETAKTAEVKTPAKPVATAKPAEAKAPTAAPSGDVYIVVKGDNPYTIAKKLKVSYTKLLEVNGIKDATKIQIGQKLKIPKQ
jgi:LysM repeat protein